MLSEFTYYPLGLVNSAGLIPGLNPNIMFNGAYVYCKNKVKRFRYKMHTQHFDTNLFYLNTNRARSSFKVQIPDNNVYNVLLTM